MTECLLAHDLGTSGNKATLFDTKGNLIKSMVIPYETNFFNSNWSEQNPEDWFEAVCQSTQQLMDGLHDHHVIAMSFSGQMMGCVVVDKEGHPLRNAIIWADQRSVEQANQLKNAIKEEDFYGITGHRISPSYSIEKLMWIRDNEPTIYQQTYKMLNPKDYIVCRLTGTFITDYSDASSTNAFDLNTFTWSKKIINASGIDYDKFPRIKPSTYSAGKLKEHIARQMGLTTDTAVIIGAGDGVCSALGAGSIEPGQAYSYLGSSAWIAVTSETPYFDPDMLTFNWAHAVPGMVTPCGTMQAAGNSYSWLKKELCKIESRIAKETQTSPYVFMNNQATASPVGSKGLLYHPYLLGERSPRWNPDCRGSFIGLKMEHTRGDMIRSVIEGIFMNMASIADALQDHVPFKEMTLIGGLAKGDIHRHIMASVLNLTLHKLEHLEEATSMGAALIAGVGIGCFEDFKAIKHFIQVDSIQEPNQEDVATYKQLKELFDKSYEQLLPIYEDLKKL